MNQSQQIKGTRLDKSSPLFLLINVIQTSIFPMVIGIYTYGKYADGMQTTIIIVGSILSLLSILQYWFYHYWIQEETIEIKEGVFFKKHRKVPYSRIQNVNVLQNPLHRILKVATLQLESASGGKPEAVMRVVKLNVVEQIKEKVRQSAVIDLSENSEVFTEPEGETQAKKLAQLSLREVIKFGFISQKGLFYVAILVGFVSQFQSYLDGWGEYISYLYDMPEIREITVFEGAIYTIIIAFLALLFLQLLSVVWAVLKFYDFKIEKNEDRLQANMGLLSKVSATIPLKRIQLFRISENPIHKYFKAQTITVETAGGVNMDQQGIIMKWLTPYIASVNVQSFIQTIEPKIKLGTIDWQLISARAWKRIFKKFILITALTSIPFIALQSYYGFLLVLLLPLAYLYSKNYVKNTYFYFDSDHISFRSGIWFGKQSHVKLNKIQTVEIMESPFDRRNNMATIEVDTAGSNLLLHHIKIPYLEKQTALEIKSFIEDKLIKQELDW